ncbi:hypothetical protein [Vulcanococcus limneticus]|jgi:hypothetical protein|uniref:hypothetical protein n=1 Tax=Vulcanococcus limneticus TaxID=2170428 RepID=UPI00398C20F5
MARPLSALRISTATRIALASAALGQALVLVLAGPFGAASAKTPPDPEADRRPAPPASRVERFDPDASTCQPENLLRGYRNQLTQFADQPPAAQAQLRRLQRDLAVGSINRCIQRGLLSKQQARTLAASMGIDRDGTAKP